MRSSFGFKRSSQKTSKEPRQDLEQNPLQVSGSQKTLVPLLVTNSERDVYQLNLSTEEKASYTETLVGSPDVHMPHNQTGLMGSSKSLNTKEDSEGQYNANKLNFESIQKPFVDQRDLLVTDQRRPIDLLHKSSHGLLKDTSCYQYREGSNPSQYPYVYGRPPKQRRIGRLFGAQEESESILKEKPLRQGNALSNDSRRPTSVRHDRYGAGELCSFPYSPGRSPIPEGFQIYDDNVGGLRNSLRQNAMNLDASNNVMQLDSYQVLTATEKRRHDTKDKGSTGVDEAPHTIEVNGADVPTTGGATVKDEDLSIQEGVSPLNIMPTIDDNFFENVEGAIKQNEIKKKKVEDLRYRHLHHALPTRGSTPARRTLTTKGRRLAKKNAQSLGQRKVQIVAQTRPFFDAAPTVTEVSLNNTFTKLKRQQVEGEEGDGSSSVPIFQNSSDVLRVVVGTTSNKPNNQTTVTEHTRGAGSASVVEHTLEGTPDPFDAYLRSQDSELNTMQFNVRGHGLFNIGQADLVATKEFLRRIEEISVRKSRTGLSSNSERKKKQDELVIEKMEAFLDNASNDDFPANLNQIDQADRDKWDEQAKKLGLQDFSELVKMHKLFKFSRRGQPDAFHTMAAREVMRSRNQQLERARTADGIDHNLSKLTGLIKAQKKQLIASQIRTSTNYTTMSLKGASSQQNKSFGKYSAKWVKPGRRALHQVSSEQTLHTSFMQEHNLKAAEKLMKHTDILRANQSSKAVVTDSMLGKEVPKSIKLIPDYINLHTETDMFPISSLWPFTGSECNNSLDNLFATESNRKFPPLRTVCNIPFGTALKRLQLKQATEYKRNFANFLTHTSNTGFNVNQKDMIRMEAPLSRQKKSHASNQNVFAPTLQQSYSEMRIPTAGMTLNLDQQDQPSAPVTAARQDDNNGKKRSQLTLQQLIKSPKGADIGTRNDTLEVTGAFVLDKVRQSSHKQSLANNEDGVSSINATKRIASSKGAFRHDSAISNSKPTTPQAVGLIQGNNQGSATSQEQVKASEQKQNLPDEGHNTNRSSISQFRQSQHARSTLNRGSTINVEIVSNKNPQKQQINQRRSLGNAMQHSISVNDVANEAEQKQQSNFKKKMTQPELHIKERNFDSKDDDEVIQQDDQPAYGNVVEVKSGTEENKVHSKQTSKQSQPVSRREGVDEQGESKTPPKSVVYSRRHSAGSRKLSSDGIIDNLKDVDANSSEDNTFVRPYVDQQRDGTSSASVPRGHHPGQSVDNGLNINVVENDPSGSSVRLESQANVMRAQTKTARTTLARAGLDPTTGAGSAESAGTTVAQILKQQATEPKRPSDADMSLRGMAIPIMDPQMSAQVVYATESNSSRVNMKQVSDVLRTIGQTSAAPASYPGGELQQPPPLNARVSAKRRPQEKQREQGTNPYANDPEDEFLTNTQQALLEEERNAEIDRFNQLYEERMRAKKRPQYNVHRCAVRKAEAEFFNMQKGILAPTYPSEGLKGFERLAACGIDEEVVRGLYKRIPSVPNVVPSADNFESQAYASKMKREPHRSQMHGQVVDMLAHSRTAKSFPRRSNLNYNTIQSKQLKQNLQKQKQKREEKERKIEQQLQDMRAYLETGELAKPGALAEAVEHLEKIAQTSNYSNRSRNKNDTAAQSLRTKSPDQADHQQILNLTFETGSQDNDDKRLKESNYARYFYTYKEANIPTMPVRGGSFIRAMHQKPQTTEMAAQCDQSSEMPSGRPKHLDYGVDTEQKVLTQSLAKRSSAIEDLDAVPQNIQEGCDSAGPIKELTSEKVSRLDRPDQRSAERPSTSAKRPLPLAQYHTLDNIQAGKATPQADLRKQQEIENFKDQNAASSLSPRSAHLRAMGFVERVKSACGNDKAKHLNKDKSVIDVSDDKMPRVNTMLMASSNNTVRASFVGTIGNMLNPTKPSSLVAQQVGEAQVNREVSADAGSRARVQYINDHDHQAFQLAINEMFQRRNSETVSSPSNQSPMLGRKRQKRVLARRSGKIRMEDSQILDPKYKVSQLKQKQKKEKNYMKPLNQIKSVELWWNTAELEQYDYRTVNGELVLNGPHHQRHVTFEQQLKDGIYVRQPMQVGRYGFASSVEKAKLSQVDLVRGNKVEVSYKEPSQEAKTEAKKSAALKCVLENQGKSIMNITKYDSREDKANGMSTSEMHDAYSKSHASSPPGHVASQSRSRSNEFSMRPNTVNDVYRGSPGRVNQNFSMILHGKALNQSGFDDLTIERSRERKMTSYKRAPEKIAIGVQLDPDQEKSGMQLASVDTAPLGFEPWNRTSRVEIFENMPRNNTSKIVTADRQSFERCTSGKVKSDFKTESNQHQLLSQVVSQRTSRAKN